MNTRYNLKYNRNIINATLHFQKDRKRKKHFGHWLQLRLGIIFLSGILISACASGPLKAPCDRYSTFCGTKTKINNW